MNTTATFSGHLHAAEASTALWQWDYGQKLFINGLTLPTVYEVHFCCAGDAETILQIGSMEDGVAIPDECLETGKHIYAYVYLHDGDSDGETEYKVTIRVNPRAKPADRSASEGTRTVLGEVMRLLQRLTSGGSGSGGGTWDYTQLLNRPKINGHTVTGDQTAAEFGLVDAVNGKGLSTNDYTNAEKTKLANAVTQDALAQALAGKVSADDLAAALADAVSQDELSQALSNVQSELTFDDTPTEDSGNPVTSDGVYAALTGKQDAESGKGLSTNDYTNAAKAIVDLLITLAAVGNNGKVIGVNGGALAAVDLPQAPQVNGHTLTGNQTGAQLGLVDAVSGKGLSANDFTDEYKQQLDGLDDALANLQESLTIDDIPMAGSDNLVTSGGVHTALAEKQDAVSGKGLSTNDFTDAEKTKLANAVTQDELSQAMAESAGESTPDWNAVSYEDGYILNRTHYTTVNFSNTYKLNCAVAAANEQSASITRNGQSYYTVYDASDTGVWHTLKLQSDKRFEIAFGGKKEIARSVRESYSTSGGYVVSLYAIYAEKNGVIIQEYYRKAQQEYDSSYSLTIYARAGSPGGTVTVKEETGETVTKLDNKYLNIDTTPLSDSVNLITSGAVYTGLSGKVNAVSGKGLSSNDYTNAEKTKLASAVTRSELTEALSDVVTQDELTEALSEVVTPDAMSDAMQAMTPDWNADDGDNGYIRHRTHYTTYSLSNPVLEASIDAVSSDGGEVFIKGSKRYPLAERIPKDTSDYVITSECCEVDYCGQKQVVYSEHHTISGSIVYTLLADELGMYIQETAQEFKIYAVVGTRAGTVKVRQVYSETVTKLDNKYLDLSTSPTAWDTKPITSHAVANALGGKVDKASGMGLSHNDFSNSDKAKLNSAVTQDVFAAALDEMQERLTFDEEPTEGSGNPVTSDGIYASIHALTARIEALNAIINLMSGGSNYAAIVDDYLVLVGDAYVDQDCYLVLPSASVENDYLII